MTGGRGERGEGTHRVFIDEQATLGQLGVVLLAGCHFPPVLYIDANGVIPLDLNTKALDGTRACNTTWTGARTQSVSACPGVLLVLCRRKCSGG